MKTVFIHWSVTIQGYILVVTLIFLPPPPFKNNIFSPNPQFKNRSILQVSEARADFQEVCCGGGGGVQGGRALPPLPLFPFYLPLFSSLLSFSFFLHSISPNPMKAQIFAPHPRRGANRKIYAPEINQYNEDDFLLILP